MTVYYNEIDKHAANWLRNLIAAGHIAAGDVDERSIEDVRPDDLRGYTQCHFFAGIGVWSHALRQAGWPDDRPVWTGSCPCQPFSAAGKGAAFADERHLWPAFHHLIKECRPAVVFGEQVASKVVDDWIDLVHADLEAVGYTFGSIPFPSAGVGAPHIRDRNYWVANSDNSGLERLGRLERFNGAQGRKAAQRHGSAPSVAVRLSDANGVMHDGGWKLGEGRRVEHSDRSAVCCLANAELQQRPDGQSRIGNVNDATGWQQGAAALTGLRGNLRTGPTNGFWSDADWLGCRDGKWRPVEPGYKQMVDGSAGSLGRVRADSIEKIEREVNDWSIRHQTDAAEALRRVWQDLQSQALCEREVGRFSGVQSPTVLLAFMRELADEGRRFPFGFACSSSQAHSELLRVMRFDPTAARTPLRRELVEQLAGKPADPLRELSSILAHHAAECWGDSCRAKAGAASHPLVNGAAARVVRLRGYGNAVNAKAAQAWIETVMECSA